MTPKIKSALYAANAAAREALLQAELAEDEDAVTRARELGSRIDELIEEYVS